MSREPTTPGLRQALSAALALALVLGAALACRGGGAKKSAPKGPREEVSTLETTRRAWVGDWEGGGATLHVEPKGYLTFEKKTGAGHTSYSGTIDHFEGDDVVLGIVVTTVTLDVQAPPHVDPDGKTRMTMEGVELTHAPSLSRPALTR